MSGQDHAHGSIRLYTILIVILAVVTFVEWQALPGMIFYSEALDKSGWLKPLLILMSAGKFFAVVFYYMHLKFDEPIFRRLFIGVLSLAFVCVMVVMAVLKALPGGAHDMARVDLIRPVPPEIAAARAATVPPPSASAPETWLAWTLPLAVTPFFGSALRPPS